MDEIMQLPGYPWELIQIPELHKRIEGSTGIFLINRMEGDLFCIQTLPTGKMAATDINECFKKGYKHTGAVLELLPGGKSDE